jgi:hypothetical protein
MMERLNLLLRSTLFMLVMTLTTVAMVIAVLLLFWLPSRRRRLFVMPWVRFVIWLSERLLGIEMRVKGAENVPTGPCVILSKHQSAWETFALQLIFPLTSFVYKRELHWLPVFGWGLRLMPFVAIDRGAGKAALKQVIERGKQRIDEGLFGGDLPGRHARGARRKAGIQNRRRDAGGRRRRAGRPGRAQFRRVLAAARVHQASRRGHGQRRPADRHGRAQGWRSECVGRKLDRVRNAAHQPASLSRCRSGETNSSCGLRPPA